MPPYAGAPTRAKKCRNCRTEFMPRSGAQLSCLVCRLAGPDEFEARSGMHGAGVPSAGYEPADDPIPHGAGAVAVVKALILAIYAQGGPFKVGSAARDHAKFLVELEEARWRRESPEGAPVSKYMCALRALVQYPAAYTEFMHP